MQPRSLEDAAVHPVQPNKGPARQRFLVRVIPTLLISSILVACGGNEPLPAPSARQLRVEGPSEVEIGIILGFKALLITPNGTSQDVSTQAEWSSSNPAIFTVDAGRGKPAAAGDVTVTARFDMLESDPKRVVVGPATYDTTGVVETEIFREPIAGARIEVPEVGLAVTTDANGRFALNGVPPMTEYRVTKEGFEPFAQRLRVSRTQPTLHISLRPLGGVPNVSGIHQLTIGGGACSGPGALSPTLARRTYQANVEQHPWGVRVWLSGATFFRNSDKGVPWPGSGDSFTGSVNSVGASFSLMGPGGGDWQYYPDVVERLSANTFLVIFGSALATRTSTGFSGTFNGTIAFYDNAGFDDIYTLPAASCQSSRHEFTLTR